MEKILSVLLVIVPIGAFILGYYLCSREYKQQIAQLEEDRERADILTQQWIEKNLPYLPEIIGDTILEPEEVNGLDKFLEDKHIDHRVPFNGC